MDYPDIDARSAGYLISYQYSDEILYWGYSHHVARLIAHVMKAVSY